MDEMSVLGVNRYMKLSEHFKLNEFLRSETASRKNIDNKPTAEAVEYMKQLCQFLLEPIRKGIRVAFNVKTGLTIWSGYRCPKLNTEVGGSKNSQHMYGMAADIIASFGVTVQELFKWIVLESGLEYDQVILEFGDWVHISYNPDYNRGEILIAYYGEDGGIFRFMSKDDIKNGKHLNYI